MAANAEVTLELILNKLVAIAEKLGEKTTAQQRQEDNLKRFNERRKETSPASSTQNMGKMATDVSDIADAARRHNNPTISNNEQQRIKNVAMIYGKTLKLEENFSVIKQLMQSMSPSKSDKRSKTTLNLPSFDVVKIKADIKSWYNKFSSSVTGLFDVDISWMQRTPRNTRRSNWLKKVQAVGDIINKQALQWFDDAQWTWFEKNVENKRRFNLSKKLEPLKNFFSTTLKGWLDASIPSMPKISSPININKNVGMLSEKFTQYKSSTQAFFMGVVDDVKAFGDKFTQLRDKTKTFFMGIGSNVKLLGDKFTQLKSGSKALLMNNINVVERFVADTKKSVKESKFVTELKNYKKRLMDFKSNASSFLTGITTQISTSITDVKKNANDYVMKLKDDIITKYTSIKDSVLKMVPSYKKPDPEKPKTTEKQTFADKFKKSAVGIVALGAGITLLVSAMIKSGMIDAKTVGVFASTVAILGAAVWGLASKAEEISKGSKAIGLLGLTFGAVVLSLRGLTDIRWDNIKEGLAAAGLAIGGMSLIAMAVGKFVEKNTIAAIGGGAALLGLTMLIGTLGKNLGEYANYDWKAIDTNLGMAAVAVIGFGALAGIIGTLMVGSQGLGALAIGGGIVAIAALAKVMGYTGDQLKVFNDISGEHLKQVGDGMMSLGAGMAAFFAAMGITGVAGVVGGIVQGMAKWFDLDLVSQLNKYEKIDTTKIDVLGKSLSSLAEGFKQFSSTSNDVKQFSTGVGGLRELEKLDIKKISSNLDSIAAKLSGIKNVSAEMGDISSKFKFELSGISEMSEAITQMGQQEIDLLQQQLAVMSDSRELLVAIRQNTASSRSMSTTSTEGSSLMFSKESSVTRQSFFNNLKMMSTTLKD